MRARTIARLLATAVLTCAIAANGSEVISVRPALTPQQAAEAARRGTPWHGAVMPPDQAHGFELRASRQRQMPHELSAPGMDWSLRANRRAGWRASSAPVRNPNARVPAGAPLARLDAPAPPDTFRIAFIRIDFLADRNDPQTTGNGRFDLTPADTTQPPLDRPPRNRGFYQDHLEALGRYYDAQSYHRTVLVGDVWPRDENSAYHCSDMADFGPWKFSRDIYPAAVHMFRTMFFAADSQSVLKGDRVPWDSYDRFVIIHAGGDFQSDVAQNSPLDIPSFTVGVTDTDRVVFPDSLNRPLDRATFVPETSNQDGYYGTLNGVIAHENGHNIFGFDDVYDINSGLPVVGFFSLMDSGNLAGSLVTLSNGEVIYAVGLVPPSVDPFQRFFTNDVLDFRDVSWGDTIAVQNSERHPDMRRVWLSSDEYLLIENRYLAPADTVKLDQDSTTRVILGPKSPDAYEYDALLPGGGLLVWQIDASVLPFFNSSFRLNPDYGVNTDPGRQGISIIEADKLDDLGDPGSPFIFGSPLDPYFKSNGGALSDTTIPNLRPHIKTFPHVKLEFTDDPGPTMHMIATHTWTLPGWPIACDLPGEGPELLAIDADGDGLPEVCWAGGGEASPDSAALFAVSANGLGLAGGPKAFAQLDTRPLQPLAAIATGPVPLGNTPRPGPSWFAVSTRATGPDLSSPGGRVWLFDQTGSPRPGWPANLPSVVTTPPVIAGSYPSAAVFVGCANGVVYKLGLDGAVLWNSAMAGAALAGGIRGRLAVTTSPSGGLAGNVVAFGGGAGDVAAAGDAVPIIVPPVSYWPQHLGSAGFTPEFLWLDFDGQGHPGGPIPVCDGGQTLVVHDRDRLWAFCATGRGLPGWGAAQYDVLNVGLAAGDADGDGYAEVLAQTQGAGVAYWNVTGSPSPGWPEPTSREGLGARAPVIAVDVDGDGRMEMVSFNGSGQLTAYDGDGRVPGGWPLGLGGYARGSAVAADLDGDGHLEIVAPDRVVPDSLRFLNVNGRFGSLYAFTLPSVAGAVSAPWPMVGGGPGRTAELVPALSPVAGPIAGGPYQSGSLKAYPNPARSRPVNFAYRLTEPAHVQFDIVDASGHRVASFTREGVQSDNVDTWDPSGAPAGLYLARVRMSGASGDHTEVVQVGVIK